MWLICTPHLGYQEQFQDEDGQEIPPPQKGATEAHQESTGSLLVGDHPAASVALRLPARTLLVEGLVTSSWAFLVGAPQQGPKRREDMERWAR